MASKAYDAIFKLSAKMDKSYNNTFNMAEEIASRTVGKIVQVAAAIGGAVLSVDKIQECTEKAIEFESAMADVAKVVDGLKDSSGNATAAYHKMSNEILDMTGKLPMAANEITQIVSAAGQSGIAAEELTKFAEDAVKMGIAFDLPAEKAGELAAVIRSSLGLSQNEFVDLADKVNYFGNTTTQSSDKLIEVVEATGLIGKQAGVSADQIVAMSAAMNGMDAANMGTALSNIYGSLMSGAGATDSAKKAWKSLGFTSTQIAQDMLVDSEATMMKIFEAMNQLPRDMLSSTTSAIFGDNKSTKMAIASFTENLDVLKQNFQDIGDSAVYAGSMETEFATRAATTENKLKLAQNAIDRLKIALGNLFLPLVGKGAGMFTDAINSFTEKIPTYASKAGTMLKNAWKAIEPVFTWIKKNPMLIAKFIAGIGAAITTYKVVDGLGGMTKAFSSLLTISNPVALGLAAATGAIALAASVISEANQKAKADNLAKHFGNISLSMSEIESAAKEIVRTENLDKVSEALKAFDDIESMKAAIDSTVEELNKTQWKVSIGLDLTEEEKSEYISNINTFISETQALLVQDQYAMTLGLTALTSDDDMGRRILQAATVFYDDNRRSVEWLGSQLAEAANDTFSDEFLNPDKLKNVVDLQKEINDYMDIFNRAQFEAKMEFIGMDAANNLTPDSFMTLMEKVNEEVQVASKEYEQLYINGLALEKAMLNEGYRTQAEYEEEIAVLHSEYLRNIGDLQAGSAKTLLDTIFKAYGDELGSVSLEQLDALTEQFMAVFQTRGFGPNAANSIFDILKSELGVNETTAAALSDLFEKYQPLLETMQQTVDSLTESGVKPSALMVETLNTSNVFGAVAGDFDAAMGAMGATLSTDNELFNSVIQQAEAAGILIPKAFIRGAEHEYPEVVKKGISTVNQYVNGLEGEASKGTMINMPIIANLNDLGVTYSYSLSDENLAAIKTRVTEELKPGTNVSLTAEANLTELTVTDEIDYANTIESIARNVESNLYPGVTANTPVTLGLSEPVIPAGYDDTASVLSSVEQNIETQLSPGVTATVPVGVLLGPNLESIETGVETICNAVNSAFGPDNAAYNEMLAKTNSVGGETVNSMISGATALTEAVTTTGTNIGDNLTGSIAAALSKGVEANIPLKLNLLDPQLPEEHFLADALNNFDIAGGSALSPDTPLIGPLQGHATGSAYTSKTFIAGERGPELITDAAGSRVFTALETQDILSDYSNLSKVFDALNDHDVNTSRYDNLFPSKPHDTNRLKSFDKARKYNSSAIEFNFSPQINVEGGGKDAGDIKRLVQMALESQYSDMREMFLDMLESYKERELRIANV